MYCCANWSFCATVFEQWDDRHQLMLVCDGDVYSFWYRCHVVSFLCMCFIQNKKTRQNGLASFIVQSPVPAKFLIFQARLQVPSPSFRTVQHQTRTKAQFCTKKANSATLQVSTPNTNNNTWSPSDNALEIAFRGRFNILLHNINKSATNGSPRAAKNLLPRKNMKMDYHMLILLGDYTYHSLSWQQAQILCILFTHQAPTQSRGQKKSRCYCIRTGHGLKRLWGKTACNLLQHVNLSRDCILLAKNRRGRRRSTQDSVLCPVYYFLARVHLSLVKCSQITN